MKKELLNRLKEIKNTPFAWLDTERQEALKEINDGSNIQFRQKLSHPWLATSHPNWNRWQCFRLNPDWEPKKTRYLVSTIDPFCGCVLICTEGKASVWKDGPTSYEAVPSTSVDELCEGGYWLEIREKDLPYMKKPNGDWEFRKARAGDIIMTVSVLGDTTQAGTFKAASACTSVLGGYRWCRVDAKVEAKVDAKVEAKKTGRWVEYPVYVKGGRYKVNVTHHTKTDRGLSFMPTLVGFGGIKFHGIDGFQMVPYILKDQKPVDPVSVRFWVEG